MVDNSDKTYYWQTGVLTDDKDDKVRLRISIVPSRPPAPSPAFLFVSDNLTF